MKSKVLALSQADHQGNINFAFVEAPAGVAAKNFVPQATLLELGIINDIKDKKNVLRVCITGSVAPIKGKELEYQIRTNLRGTTIEVPGASFALNQQRQIARIDSQTDIMAAKIKQQLTIANSLGMAVTFAEIAENVTKSMDAASAASRARNRVAQGNFGAKPVIERENEITIN